MPCCSCSRRSLQAWRGTFLQKNPLLFCGFMIQNSKSDILCCLQVLLGTDSHTCTAGAFGQFATGIGNTDAGFVLGTGKLLLKVCGCCILFHHVTLISSTCHSYRFYAKDIIPRALVSNNIRLVNMGPLPPLNLPIALHSSHP